MSDLIPKRTDEVVLYLDADRHQIDALRKVLTQAVENAANAIVDAAKASPLRIGDAPEPPKLIGDDPNVIAAAGAYDEFVAEAAERGVKVEVTYMGGRKWRGFVAAHPPRKDNEADEEWGFNFLTLGDDVVPPCVTAIGGKALDSAEREAAIDDLSDGDFSRVYSAVLKINTGRGPDPKDSILAKLPKTSPETSESPERLG